MWSGDRRTSPEGLPSALWGGSGMGVRGIRMRLGTKTNANQRATVTLGIAFFLALLAPVCSQPLYGDPKIVPTAGLDEKLRAVEVLPINLPIGTRISRVGVEGRSALLTDTH